MDHQAFAQLLGNYGEFVGAIAVVVTLAYLVVQVRQNTQMIRANIRQARSDSSVSLYSLGATTQIAEIRAKERKGEPLTDVEEERSSLWYIAVWRGQQTIFFQSHEGLLDLQTESEQAGIVRALMAFPSSVRFWMQQKHTFDSRFVAWVDEQLALAERP